MRKFNLAFFPGLLAIGMYSLAQTYIPTIPAPVPITGIGTQVQVGSARLINQTTTVGPTTLLTTGAQTAQYLIAATAYCDVAAAGATVALVVNSTDPSGTVQSVSSNATCTTLGASSFAALRSTIAAKNTTAITYTATIAGTPTYDVRVEIFQLSLN